jgi:hypothetical protein
MSGVWSESAMGQHKARIASGGRQLRLTLALARHIPGLGSLCVCFVIAKTGGRLRRPSAQLSPPLPHRMSRVSLSIVRRPISARSPFPPPPSDDSSASHSAILQPLCFVVPLAPPTPLPPASPHPPQLPSNISSRSSSAALSPSTVVSALARCRCRAPHPPLRCGPPWGTPAA